MPGIGRNGNGNILIESGIIVSQGGSYAAGIGGSCGFEGGSITINGGGITANGGIFYGAGIGGGSEGSGGTISINGGTIKPAGGVQAACIGGGKNGSGGTFQTQKTGEANGNAVIFASSITDQSGKAEDAANPWSGVIFEDNNGAVYGNVTPAYNFTIESGKGLLVPTDSMLTISGITAVNNGNVYVDGAVSGLDGDLYYPLTITGGTASPIYTYSGNTYGKAGETVTLTGTDVPVGQAVSGWTTSYGGVTVENNAFTMPAFALTVTAQYIDAPVLSDFSVTQGETPNSYTVKFTSDPAGTWYYTIDRKGTADTSDFTSWISGSCIAGENTITLIDQIAGENLHLTVKNEFGLCSAMKSTQISNTYTPLSLSLFMQYLPFMIDYINAKPLYQHEVPNEAALQERLNELMSAWIAEYFADNSEMMELWESISPKFRAYLIKYPVAGTEDTTDGVNGSFAFDMTATFEGWTSVAYLEDDSEQWVLDPPVIVAEPYYTVTLNADGGTVNSDNVTGYVYGVGATLPTDMTRWGYGFVGWYDDETGEKVTAVSGTDWGNRSFTARWALGGTAPTNTVTIPATVELGGTVTVSAGGASLVEGSQLVVTLSGTNDTGNAFTLKTDEGAELSYSITKDSTALCVGSAILTVAGGTADNTGSAVLTFSAPTTAIQYSGAYKGTVTFTVSIEEVSTP